jgi:flagellar basal-body rod protein FlgG
MTRGMYAAATGMLANQTAQDAIAENLANANTTGYKQEIPQFQTFGDTLLSRISGGSPQAAVGGLGSGVTISGLATDFGDGALEKTDNSLDVALTGDAALVVQTPQGLRLTQDGALTLNQQGMLILADGGYPVLSQSGAPIRIPAKAKNVVINTNGRILADGAVVGTLRLGGVSRADDAVKMGDNLYSEATIRSASLSASVQQGYLEASNVSVVKEMVAMIAVNRAYETNSKMLKAEDEATDKAVNDVAKM